MVQWSEAAALERRSGLARERASFGISALLFLASAVTTVYWCRSMPGDMAMPGGGTMSMVWMGMSGQTWLGAAASFVEMSVVMMLAMMLPSLVSMLLRYRDSVRGSDQARLGRLTALAGAAWSVYSHLLSRGQEIVFPEDTPMQIRFGQQHPRPATPLNPAAPAAKPGA
jgi:predicted metal-binding membrane protein